MIDLRPEGLVSFASSATLSVGILCSPVACSMTALLKLDFLTCDVKLSTIFSIVIEPCAGSSLCILETMP